MNFTLSLAGIDRLHNFVASFKHAATSVIKESFPIAATGDERLLRRWFFSSRFLEFQKYTATQTPGLSTPLRILIEFKISKPYVHKFVLLRGLFLFSRPRHIAVSSNAADKTFELSASDGSAEILISYLGKILNTFQTELKFAKSLRAARKFEQSLKVKQLKVYGNLIQSTR
jgi:hypothetical protein